MSMNSKQIFVTLVRDIVALWLLCKYKLVVLKRTVHKCKYYYCYGMDFVVLYGFSNKLNIHSGSSLDYSNK